jgi:Uma2 family endonuclease
MALHEIVLPETRPETEWVRGRALQKVSPTYDHARLQGLLFAALDAWANGWRGRVATEWRFRVAPPRAIVRPLVPDVAYLSYADLAADAPREAVQTPLGAPTVAVEILSPDDREPDVADKIATYLAAGTSAVFVVDPSDATITVHDGTARVWRTNETLTHPALPGFVLDLGALFARARP